MTVVALDDDIDRLFATPPDRFVVERDALVADLRKEGRKDGAATARKPRHPGREGPPATPRRICAPDRHTGPSAQISREDGVS